MQSLPHALLVLPLLAHSATPAASSSAPLPIPPVAASASPPSVGSTLAPAPPKAPAPRRRSELGNVRFLLDEGTPNTTVHVRGHAARWGTDMVIDGPSDQWTSVCTAPCSAFFAEGRYQFGLERPGGEVTHVATFDIGQQPVTLHLSSSSAGATQLLGAGIIVLSLGLSAFLLTRPTNCSQERCEATSAGLQAAGDAARAVLVLGVGLPLGVILASQSDGVELKRSQKAQVRVQPSLGLGGLGLTGSF